MEIKEIAKQTAYWISCIDSHDRTYRIEMAIEQAIKQALGIDIDDEALSTTKQPTKG